MNSEKNITVFQNVNKLFETATGFILELAHKSIQEKGRFVIVLSGGNTPEQLYAILSEEPFRSQMPWKDTFVFWGDERCVPFDNVQNNAHMAILLLLNKVDIPPYNIFRIPVNISPAKAAVKYEQEIRGFFGDEPLRFDLVLLGLGENGHTASLFPGTKVINEQMEGVREVYVEEEKMFRITMTAPLFNKAFNILFLVTGKQKAAILEKVLTASYNPVDIPVQLIKPVDGKIYWFVDSLAASFIKA